MGRRLRFIPPDSLVEVTCRTVQGRLLLTPTSFCRDATLGVLARAVRLYPVEVHAFAFLSNHFHLLLTVRDAQRLSEFMCYLNSNLAREIGRLVRWRDRFWGRRYQAIVVSDEPESQVARLRYLLAHGCKEGLVMRPGDWPGAHAAQALIDDRPLLGHWFDRTLEYRARRKRLPVDPRAFVSPEVFRLAPLPCWRHLPAEVRQGAIKALLDDIQSEAERLLAEGGRIPQGIEALQRQNPHLEPNRLKRGPAPVVHAVTREARQAFQQLYRDFLSAFRAAAARFARGELAVEFPRGSFPPRLRAASAFI